VNENVLSALDFAQGPVFRCAFALMLLGLLRNIVLAVSDTVAAYLTTDEKPIFWRRFRQHIWWFLFPGVVLHNARPGDSTRTYIYHLGLFTVALVFRITAVLVPAFMVAHVYLWERNIGFAWPTMSAALADKLSAVTIVAGVVLFLGRLYSPMLRKIEPSWSFLKPLILILPFVTGVMAMHPTWSPFDYHLVLLIHVLSASLVFVMVPFGRMLMSVHTSLEEIVPEAVWRRPLTQTPATAGE
jgi:hypothetical protein